MAILPQQVRLRKRFEALCNLKSAAFRSKNGELLEAIEPGDLQRGACQSISFRHIVCITADGGQLWPCLILSNGDSVYKLSNSLPSLPFLLVIPGALFRCTLDSPLSNTPVPFSWFPQFSVIQASTLTGNYLASRPAAFHELSFTCRSVGISAD